jgi:hypothetical protein
MADWKEIGTVDGWELRMGTEKVDDRKMSQQVEVHVQQLQLVGRTTGSKTGVC